MGTIANVFMTGILFLAAVQPAVAQDRAYPAQRKLDENLSKTMDALDIKAMLDEEVAIKGVLFNMATVHLTAPSVPLSDNLDNQHPKGWTGSETRMLDLQARLLLHKMSATDQICGKGSARDGDCADRVKEVLTMLLKRIDAMSPEELKAYRLTVVQDQDKATADIAMQQKTINRLVAGRKVILGQLLREVTTDAVMTTAFTGMAETKTGGAYGTAGDGTAIKAGVLASATIQSGSHDAFQRIETRNVIVNEQVETGAELVGGTADIYPDAKPGPDTQ